MSAPQKDTLLLPVSLGLLVVLGIIFSLVFVSLLQFHSGNRGMERLVEMSRIKTDATSEMRATMRQFNGHPQLILGQLDRLTELEHENSLAILAASARHYDGIHRLLLALGAIATVICLLIIRMTGHRIATRNRLLKYHSSHDNITGLINRREFETRVERAISHARTHSATHALLYLHIECSMTVHAACGAEAHDDLLQQVGQLMLSSVRKRDTLGRLGGDEFGMLLENCPLDKAVKVANKLQTALMAFSFCRGEDTYTPMVGIGVAPIDRGSPDIAGTMSAADSACYIARETGRDKIQVAQTGDRRLQERHGKMQWISRLEKAFAENRFTLYFQPIVPGAGGSRQGKHIEILLRMIDDDGSILAPGNFLPAAEKYQQAPAIDRWVIETAMSWLARESAFSHWPVRITINLSGQSIGDSGMLQFIIDQSRRMGLAPQQICFEIAERVVISDITAVTSFMLTLRGHGFRISLDSFGSALSSFTYLKKFPADYLKIDGTYVRDILSDPVDHALVKAIIDLGRLLGKETIAEHVETLPVAEELKKLGVNHLQGYAYSLPQSLDDFAHVMGPRLVVVSS